MNITVKVGAEEFSLYGVDFVPQSGDRIIKDDNIYDVIKRIWDEDNSESIIIAKLVCKRITADLTDQEIIEMVNSGQPLAAVKAYKEIHSVSLKEAKDWVDAHRN